MIRALGGILIVALGVSVSVPAANAQSSAKVPGDLPVQRPAKIELFINAKTVKALGLTIPQQFVLRADEIIQ